MMHGHTYIKFVLLSTIAFIHWFVISTPLITPVSNLPVS